MLYFFYSCLSFSRFHFFSFSISLFLWLSFSRFWSLAFALSLSFSHFLFFFHLLFFFSVFLLFSLFRCLSFVPAFASIFDLLFSLSYLRVLPFFSCHFSILCLTFSFLLQGFFSLSPLTLDIKEQFFIFINPQFLFRFHIDNIQDLSCCSGLEKRVQCDLCNCLPDSLATREGLYRRGIS